MSVASRSSTNSLAKDSRVLMGNNAGARLRVASVASGTVTVDSVAELTGTSLYASSTPGQLIILSAAVATNQGKMADVNSIAGAVLTVDVDFTTMLAAGDIIAVIPPLSVELFMPPQGHTLQATLANDQTMGLTDTFLTHNTPMQVEVGGDVPFFQTLTSVGLMRFLAFGIGAYKYITRSVADGVTNSTTTVTSATAAFVAADVGKALVGAGIPTGAVIVTVSSGTSVIISLPATASASGVTLAIGGVHKYRPIEANDGTFTDTEDATIWAQDGNGIVRQAFFGLFGTRLTLDYPEGGVGTGSISTLGSGAVREIGGTGKLFTTGANNYVRSDFACDTGPRVTFRSAFVELGGTFGDALTGAAETTVKNLTITVDRGALQDRTLGDPYIIKAEEDMFKVTVSGTRILSNDTYHEYANGGANDAEPGSGSKTNTRMLIKAISPQDTTKTLTVDIPKGFFDGAPIRRQRGRFMQEFTYELEATKDANNCVSTSVPPVEISLYNGIPTNVATAL